MRSARIVAVALAALLGLVGCVPGSSPVETAPDEDTRTEKGPRTTPRPTATPTPEAAEAEELVVVKSAFGRTDHDNTMWWYAVVLDNPNPDWIFDFAEVTVEAIGADGTILDSGSDYLTILPGEFAVSGTFFDVGSAEIDHLDVRGPVADDAEAAPSDGVGELTVSDIDSSANEYMTTVGGILSGTFASEQELVKVVVIASNAAGEIIGADFTFVDRLPVDGRVRFEVTFFDTFPADTGYAAYPSL